MSSSFALMRFEKTGNIYYGCYDGTSDVLIPFIFTAEECYNKETDCYCAISYGKKLRKEREWRVPDDIPDLDAVEIYSDYGGGFYWSGSGSESLRMITTGLDPLYELEEDEKDGQPDWVVAFLKSLEDEHV